MTIRLTSCRISPDEGIEGAEAFEDDEAFRHNGAFESDEPSDNGENDENDESGENGENDENDENEENEENEENDENEESHESFDILVGTGSSQMRFNAELKKLMQRSKFFPVARSACWTPKTKPTRFPDQDPSTFDLYLDTVYDDYVPGRPYPKFARWYEENYSKIWPRKHTEEDTEQYDTVTQNFREDRYMEIVNLYTLADYLMDPVTANMAVDGLRDFMREHCYTPSADVINHVMSSTKNDDGLRVVLADFFVYNSSQSLDHSMPKEFFNLIAEMYEWMKDFHHIEVSKDNIAEFENGTGMVRWDDYEYYQDFEDAKQFLDECS